MPPAVKRRLVTLAAAGSLLCAAIVAVWITSRQRTVWIAFGYHEVSYQLRAVDGVILAGRVMLPGSEQRDGLTVGSESRPLLNQWLMWPVPTRANRVGFGLLFDGSTRRAAPWDVRLVMFPIWGLLVIPASIIHVLLRRHHKLGQCRQCGYDLRATPHRCPECGAVPAAVR
jgi:hypothetical protein